MGNDVAPFVSIIFPIFEEKLRFPGLVSALAKFSEKEKPYRFEYIFVDDGSSPETKALCESLSGKIPNSKFISCPENLGKGSAVSVGAKVARGELIGFLDCDLSIGLENIEPAISLLLANDVGLVMANRRAKKFFFHTFPIRNITSFLLHFFCLTFVLTNKYQDLMAGLKFIRTSHRKVLFEPLFTKGFAFDIELLRRAELSNIKIASIPVIYTHNSNSKVHPIGHSLRTFIEVCTIRKRLSRSK